MSEHSFFRLPAVALVVAVGTIPALAHSRPKTMTPPANSTVSAPAELSVFFTEPLEPKFSSLQLLDSHGQVLSTSASVVEPSNHAHMTLALPKLAPGTYNVHWVSAALDGHRMDGTYSFAVK
jgi:methionine-rich copper-binding protein CopC